MLVLVWLWAVRFGSRAKLPFAWKRRGAHRYKALSFRKCTLNIRNPNQIWLVLIDKTRMRSTLRNGRLKWGYMESWQSGWMRRSWKPFRLNTYWGSNPWLSAIAETVQVRPLIRRNANYKGYRLYRECGVIGTRLLWEQESQCKSDIFDQRS